jgi:outer membrane immunogenic protein
MLIRRLATCIAASATLVGSALAADLPTHKAPPAPLAPVEAPFTWTGFYVGGQGGYSWDGEEIYTNTWSHGLERSGGFGGLDVGYNYQISNFVVGAQLNYNLSSIKGSESPLPTYTISTDVNSFGSIDGLLGFTPISRWMVFGLLGFAGADISHTITLTGIETDNFRTFQTGYDWGGGIGYAFTNQFTASVAYRTYNFGNHDFASVGLLGPNHTHENLSSVFVQLTYSFK